MNIFLDTNAIIYSFKQKLDLKYEIERLLPGKKKIFLLTCVDEELRLKAKNDYAIIKKILEKNGVIIIKVNKIGSVDDTLIHEASKVPDSVLITNDKELKQKALKKRIKVITVRQGKYLDFA